MARIQTDKTEPTLERKFHELGVREVLVDEPREDEKGTYRYVEAAYWEGSISKDADTQLRPGRVQLQHARGRIYADGVNSFKIHYQETGNSRIKEYDVRGVPSWRRMDTGLFVPMVDVPKIEQSERVLWEREEFARDMQVEIEDILERYRLRALENMYFEERPDRRGTTYAGQVIGGAADAREIGNDGFGFSSTDSLDYIMGHSVEDNRRNCGFYFAGSLPVTGSTINSATLQLYCWPPGGDDLNATIHAHDVDATTNFSSNADVTGRTRTTAGVLKTTTNSPAGFVSLTGLASVVQEVVDRPSFDGAAMTMLAIAGTNTNPFYMEMVESGSTKGAKLDIDYTIAATGGRKNPLGYPLRGPLGGPLG